MLMLARQGTLFQGPPEISHHKCQSYLNVREELCFLSSCLLQSHCCSGLILAAEV